MVSGNNIQTSKEYTNLLNEICLKVNKAQLVAVVTVNKGLIELYFEIGLILLKRQKEYNWGEKFLSIVAQDLKKEFSHIKGMSVRNLQYMRKFAATFGQEAIAQQLVAQLCIPWGHHTVLLDKQLSNNVYQWYVEQSIEHGWSRNTLVIKLESNLYQRSVHAEKVSNFSKVLPPSQSDLANSFFKDPHIFQFIDECQEEKELEKSLVKHIQKFMLELGKGFAFIGNQYQLNVGGDLFFIDILFYHVKLKCYVAIELKIGKFKPEYAGKMQFYLTALDREVKDSSDNPSIGIILCKEKNKLVAEYSLDGITVPLGIADYKLKHSIPDMLKQSLPSPEELEAELSEEEVVGGDKQH